MSHEPGSRLARDESAALVELRFGLFLGLLRGRRLDLDRVQDRLELRVEVGVVVELRADSDGVGLADPKEPQHSLYSLPPIDDLLAGRLPSDPLLDLGLCDRLFDSERFLDAHVHAVQKSWELCVDADNHIHTGCRGIVDVQQHAGRVLLFRNPEAPRVLERNSLFVVGQRKLAVIGPYWWVCALRAEQRDMKADTSQLYDRDRAVEFYEARFEQGYMDEWPAERKRRLVEVIRRLPLPAAGRALDFGCGNGVLTDVVRQALPDWEVCGVDISACAVRNARSRYPLCEFLEATEIDRKFDLVFTHHVLEHVFDLSTVIGEMDACLEPSSFMFHILPCGNEGSLEHRVCLLRRDGIDDKLEGRFFYEDEGHVRRLTTKELQAICSARGFALSREFYSNQRDGAVEWITNSSPRFVMAFADPHKAIDDEAKRELKRIRGMLVLVAALRLPIRLFREMIAQRQRRKLKHVLALLVIAPMLPLSVGIDHHWKRKAAREWSKRKTDPAGSAMFLLFSREI